MQIDSARNLKAEVFKAVLGYEPHGGSLGSIAAFRADGLPGFLNPKVLHAAETGGTYFGPELDIALGFVAVDGFNRRNSKDIQLAILLRDKRRRDSPLVASIMRAARGEAVVIQTGRIRAQAFPLDRERPARVGCSVGHKAGRVGSLGCFVKTEHHPVAALSANHVLARGNLASIGDQILQPGRPDGGIDPSDRLGNLIGFHPLGLAPQHINYVDCALASVNPSADGRSRPFSVALPPGSPASRLNGKSVQPQIDMPVWKVGRTTVLTSGVIQLIEVDHVHVDMGASGSSRLMLRFDEQLAISGRIDAGAFSKNGDSGALVYEEEGSAVGLVVAGSDSGALNDRALTFASPISAVLAALGAELVV